jgi:hypothetical protein
LWFCASPPPPRKSIFVGGFRSNPSI